MEMVVKQAAGILAIGLEAVAATVIAFGAAQAIVNLFIVRRPRSTRLFAAKKEVWQGFGVWLLLGLEFELAADIVRTAITPSWTELGQLAAIAVIRTFLNYFLEKDIEKLSATARRPDRDVNESRSGS